LAPGRRRSGYASRPGARGRWECDAASDQGRVTVIVPWWLTVPPFGPVALPL